jgi:hypothetical protein
MEGPERRSRDRDEARTMVFMTVSLSKFAVGAITEWRTVRLLAPAKVNRAGGLRRELQRNEPCALVTSVTKGLGSTPAAGTPEVVLTRFDFNGIRGFLWDDRIIHGFPLFVILVGLGPRNQSGSFLDRRFFYPCFFAPER